MPTKAEMYAQMANSVATRLTGSWQDWAAFLTTAARLYKYPYQEQLMIYAQRPEATACAEYDLWNDKMGRYVKRGSQGIALLDDSGDRPRLRYVFDISDTGTRPNSRNLTLWSMEPEHHELVSAMLENRYGIADQSLPQQIANIAGVLANRYWNDNRDDILRIVDGSFLEEYDELNIAMQFRSAAAISITYAIMSRCGLEPEQYFGYEDFMSIFDFNTPETIASLGTAVSQSCQEVLRQIGITIQNAEREKIAERSQNHEQQPDIHEERGLSDSRPEAEQPAGNASGQVREDAQELPEGAPSRGLQPNASLGETVPASAGNRADSTEPLGADDAGAGEGGGRDGGAEGVRPDEMGGPDEQLQGAGGRNDPEGNSVQLSRFPTEQAQIKHIDAAESVKAPSAFSISQADIDTELRRGSGFENGKLRIYAMYQHGADAKDAAAFLKSEYGTGGHSAEFLDGSHGFVNYRPSDGITFDTYQENAKTVVKWAAVEKRLRELIREGTYLSEGEKAEYAALEQQYAGFGGIPMPAPAAAFPSPEQAAAAENRAHEENADNNERFAVIESENGYAVWDELHNAYYVDDDGISEEFISEWQANDYLYQVREAVAQKEILEAAGAKKTEKTSLPQSAPEREQAMPKPLRAVTDAEIDAALQRWNGDLKSKQHTNSYMLTHARDKETAAWLQNEFGGGKTSFTVAIEGAEPVELSWTKAQRRIARMVKEDTFYTQEEHDNLDDVDPDDLRDRLAQAGIVNGEVADPAALSQNPFIQQVVADAENVTQAEDEPAQVFPFSVGDTVYLENGKPFIITQVRDSSIQLRDPTLRYPIFRAESSESFARLMERYPQPGKPAPAAQAPAQPEMTAEPVAVYPADENNLPYDMPKTDR